MGNYDGSESGMALWKIAKKYVLADNFFMGAWRFVSNHQYLICACAPRYPNADAPESPAKIRFPPSMWTPVATSSDSPRQQCRQPRYWMVRRFT
jgi:phospholipase C